MTRLPSSRAEHRTGESMIGLNGTFAPPLLAHARFAGRNGLCLSDGMSSASDPMYGPAVRCKKTFPSLRAVAVLHQCIRPLIGAFVLRAIMGISARAISLADRPQWTMWVASVRMRREDRSSISFLILSQTLAG